MFDFFFFFYNGYPFVKLLALLLKIEFIYLFFKSFFKFLSWRCSMSRQGKKTHIYNKITCLKCVTSLSVVFSSAYMYTPIHIWLDLWCAHCHFSLFSKHWNKSQLFSMYPVVCCDLRFHYFCPVLSEIIASELEKYRNTMFLSVLEYLTLTWKTHALLFHPSLCLCSPWIPDRRWWRGCRWLTWRTLGDSMPDAGGR